MLRCCQVQQKNAKNDVPTGESSTSTFTMQCNLSQIHLTEFIPLGFPDVSLVRPMAQALDTFLSETRGNIKDATTLTETVNFPVKVQSSSSTCAIETGKMKSEGKEMQIIPVYFSEPQEDCTLKSSSTTIDF